MIGIVVITHGQLAHELVAAARAIVGEISRIAAVSIGWSDDMTVARNGKAMDGKSILGILLLAASHGTDLELTADGEDEAPALEALATLVESGFGETP